MRKVSWVDWVLFIFCGLILAVMLKSLIGWTNSGIALFSATSPLVFPFVVLCGMFICWILTIIKEIKKAQHTEEDGEENKLLNSNVRMAGVYATGVLLYGIIVSRLGFLITSIIFLIIGMVYMNYDEIPIIHKIRKAALVSVIAVPTLYFIFYKVFNVILP
jgi:hypothetical protein